MQDMIGRLAVITGAGGGIGSALAERLVSSGCDLALCDIDPNTLSATVERCARLRPDARITSAIVDVADRASLDRFAAAVREDQATDHVDLLFNNAGVGGGESLVTSSEAEWDRTFEITWGGVYRTTRAFLPLLIAAPSAVIVNVSSINAVWATLGRGSPVNAYASAKFAVRGFTESLHHDLEANAPHVRACLVLPGGVRTSITANTAAIHGRSPADMSAEQLAIERQRLVAAGADVSGVGDDELRDRLARQLLAVSEQWNVTAAAAAEQIVDGVRRGRRRIVVGPAAIGLDRMARWFPSRIYEIPNRLLPRVAQAGAPLHDLRARLARRRSAG